MAKNYKEGGMFVRNFCERIIDKFGPRLPGSEEERMAADEIAKEFSKVTGKESVIEPFKMAPIASIGAISLLGLGGFICTIAYYLSPIASLIMTAFLLIFTIFQIVFYTGIFDFLFKKKESKNVYNVLNGGEKIDYTIILSGHIDTSWNWNHAEKNCKTMIPKTVYGVMCFFVLLGLSIARVILGNFRASWDSPINIFFFAAPALLIVGFYWVSTFLSYDKKKASPGAMDNLSGIGVALAVTKYYKENPEALPENCRIIVAGIGSEEAGLKGSLAFMKAHKGDNELLVNPYFINLDSFRDYDFFNVVKGDLWLFSKFDKELIDLSVESMKEAGLPNISIIKNPVGGCDSTPIKRAGYKTVTLNAQNPTCTSYYHTCNDTVSGLNINSLEKACECVTNLTEKIHKLHNK